MPGSIADVRSPGGLVRPVAGIPPGDFGRSEYGTVIPASIVRRRPACVLEAAPRRGLEQVPGPDTRRGSNVWHGMHAPFEPDAYPEVRR